MRMTTVFKMLLNLQGLRVRSVNFDLDSDCIRVAVAPTFRKHRCPHCDFCTVGRYDSDLRRWRHVALGRWRIVLEYQICRLSCPRHGVVTEVVPWAQPRSAFTTDFEDLVAWTARTMDKTAVTRLLHIAWATVGEVIERVVQRKQDPDRLNNLYFIGVDEVSYRKGHKYLTIVADHLTGKPVFITEGRSQESLGKYFDELGPERAKELAGVSMDMCPSYIAEVQQKAPNAEIAFDPFHVVKLASEAVQEVRRSEVRDNKGTPAAKILKDARWSLLRAQESQVDEDRLRLSEVAALNKPVYRAYLLKEELRVLYLCPMEAAEGHLDAWLSWASRSQLDPFIRLARTLRTHRDGVLAAIRLGLSNGRLEGLNNKVGVIKRRAYGFHSAAALISMIFLCCTNLPITLPI